jgi:hypothetical protein
VGSDWDGPVLTPERLQQTRGGPEAVISRFEHLVLAQDVLWDEGKAGDWAKVVQVALQGWWSGIRN